MAIDWSKERWSHGKTTLPQAFGFSNLQFKFPRLQATLPTEAAQAAQSRQGKLGKAPKNAKHYTQEQLQQLWIQAGGDPTKALMASAIAEAESRGDAGATDHDSNGTTDRGLWQINSVHGSLSTYNPLANARAAVQISDNGRNWSPWVTFHNGDYQEFM